MKDYIENVKRTECDYEEPVKRLSNETLARLMHGAMGVSTEAGELLDALKKHIYYGTPLDIVNIKEELGDSLWYIGIICDVVGASFEELADANIKKLKARYPEKFTQDKAENRDLRIEREILENN